jgi:hypothetical protein
MLRAALIACLPWLGLLVLLFGLLWLWVRLFRPPISLRRLTTLHHDEAGGVQSLSFVATLPIFVMVIMLIVQVSQVMIANIVVQYAAFAAARSAVVWIPAGVDGGPDEPENWISSLSLERIDSGYWVYRVAADPHSPKVARIHRAAALACMPLAPSRDAGGAARPSPLSDSVTRAYLAVSPGAEANERVPARIASKLAYSLANTEVEIRRTVPHDHWVVPPPPDAPYWWITYRDQITVTVTHRFALLPGPGRMLARSTSAGGHDPVSGRIDRQGSYYTIPIVATATLPNEGGRSAWRYRFDASDVRN